jgi:hypothetical protein
VRSVSPRFEIPIAVGVAIALAGCASTQQKNARLVLLNERTLDSQTSVRVTHINPQVAVSRVALVRGSGGAAVAVTLHNLAAHPLSDLPISVGIVPRQGARHYLNRRANLGYLDNHIPALGPGATITWVLPLRQTRQPAGRPFADVGFARTPASTRNRTLPAIDVSTATAGGPHGFEVTVANRSGVPQTRLAVYAVATRAGRYVAAGRATIGELSGGAHRTLRLALRGNSTGATFELFAPPTIFN